jgi:hypothetical protein
MIKIFYNIFIDGSCYAGPGLARPDLMGCTVSGTTGLGAGLGLTRPASFCVEPILPCFKPVYLAWRRWLGKVYFFIL